MKNRQEMSYDEITRREKVRNIGTICVMTILAIGFVIAVAYIIKTTTINPL